MHNSKKNNLIKSSVRQALFILLLEKDLKKIKITDVVKKAGVSRASFYRYYSSLDLVLKDAINSKVLELDSLLKKDFNYDLTLILNTFKKYKTYLDILLKSGYFHLILDVFNQHFNDYDYYSYAWCGFFYNILYRWVYFGMRESAEEMSDIVLRAIKEISISLNNNETLC